MFLERVLLWYKNSLRLLLTLGPLLTVRRIAICRMKARSVCHMVGGIRTLSTHHAVIFTPAKVFLNLLICQRARPLLSGEHSLESVLLPKQAIHTVMWSPTICRASSRRHSFCLCLEPPPKQLKYVCIELSLWCALLGVDDRLAFGLDLTQQT